MDERRWVGDMDRQDKAKNDLGNVQGLKGFQLQDGVYNNGHTPMLIIDSATGAIIDGNRAAYSYYGYTSEELRQLNITDINVLDKQEVFRQIAQAEEQGRKYFEFRHRLADGTIREVEVYSGPLYMEGEKVLFSIIHDIQDKKELEEKAQQQESFFRNLFENSPEAIAILDNEFGVLNINQSFERLFQYTLEEIIGRNITQVICEEKLYNESSYFKDCIQHGEFVRRETQRLRRDGRLISVSFLGYPIFSEGKQIGVYVIYSDLSAVKEIASKERLFGEIFKNNTVGVMVTDIEGSIKWINPSFTRITGYEINDVIGQNPCILKSGQQDAEFYSNMWNSILSIGKWQGEIFNKRKNGEIYEQWLNIIAIKDDFDQTEYFVGMISDITDAKKQEHRIEVLTNTDGLTGLHNRDYFLNKLNYELLSRKKEVDLKKELAVVFLDIDDFKSINDTLGHLVGDLILRDFSKRLKESIRESDLAARFGGDEFIILLSSIKEDHEIISIAGRILEATNKPFFIDNIELHITASLGIARYPKDGQDSTSLIRNADIAMYKSKSSHTSKITLFEPSLDEKVKEYFKLKSNMRNALFNKEFYLEYQPIVDVLQNQVIGVEALLRWRMRDGALIPPMKFIPIAEKNGFMPAIGEWIIRSACRQYKEWLDKGINLKFISINISVIQLEESNFSRLMQNILEETQLEPGYVQLEITETVFTKNYNNLVETVKELSRLGIKVAIDDFGTGYSSLGQLSRLDITKLKIDKSFIMDINQNANKQKIVRAIISLAKSLRLELVAEGVETKEQLEFLVKNECKVVQGFIFSKPINANKLEELIKNI